VDLEDPVTTPTARPAGREKLQLPPTPRRGLEAQVAASSHRPTLDEPKQRGVQPRGVVVEPRLVRSRWRPGRSHRRHSRRLLPAKPTSDRGRKRSSEGRSTKEIPICLKNTRQLRSLQCRCLDVRAK
jgi:hypothetical protein